MGEFVINVEKSKRDVLIDFFMDSNSSNIPFLCSEIKSLHNCFNYQQDLNKVLNKLVKDGFICKKRVKVNGYVRVFYFRRVLK